MENYIPVFILNKLVILPNQEIKIDINNDGSKKVIKDACKKSNDKVLVIAPKNPLEENPSFDDLPNVGVIAKVKSKLELSTGTLRTVLKGISRVKLDKYFQNSETGILKCLYEKIDLPEIEKTKELALKRKLISLTKEYIEINPEMSNSIYQILKEDANLSHMADVIISFMPFDFAKKTEYMETINPYNRASKLIEDLTNEIKVSNVDRELEEKLKDNLEQEQREFILKEKLKEINNELGNNKTEEIERLNEKVKSLNIDEDFKNKLLSDITKYSNSSEFSPESAVLKNYIDTVINLPYDRSTDENLDSKEIEKRLNESHYGLNEIKERITEYAALKSKNKDLKSPIITLVGPPGCGKTSIAMSIASSLNRKFYKMSVGGLNDSLELTGSRKTYLGAAPGKIMQGIIKTDVNNPVILIDEVDKMVKNYKGDPASTLLEIIDETQNKYFVDNYIEDAFDLSKVLFIMTANNEEDIPYTLKDRMEIIHINGYSLNDKVDIAKNYLLKSIYEEYNVSYKINKDVIEYIISKYTRESGVRELKRVLEKLIRKIIINDKELKTITITVATKYLGKENITYLPKIRDYGICNTLAYTTLGGALSHVEVSKFNGNGNIYITGNAGDILKESAYVVRSLIASNYDIDISGVDIHIHFMEASLKKDGPSGGVSIAVAMLSLFEKRLIDGDIAFTGELTLKGDILPIGHLKEKLEVAYSEGIKTVFIPRSNETDLLDLPGYLFENLDIRMVNNFSEIYDALFH